MTLVSDWPSLRGQLVCAASLYGDAGAGHVVDWLAHEEGRVDDPEFARRFSDHIDLPGIASLDYAQRHVAARTGSLIGGIRFYARDIRQPFVEVIAHDFEDITALAHVVSSEWRDFAPQRLRMTVTPDASLPTTAVLDMSLYAARYRDLSPSSQPVALSQFDNPDQARALVRDRFDLLAKEDPVLHSHVFPTSADTLDEMHEAKQLHRIDADGQAAVGLIAAAPGRIGWVAGDEIIEEVVAIAYAGHGYAAAAQYALSSHHVGRPDTHLIGTIHSQNIASRRSAERAGRKRVLDYVFLSLET